MKAISTIVDNINSEDWKYLVLGLKEKLNLSQTKLCDLLYLKSKNSAASYWIGGNGLPSYENKLKIVDISINHNLKVSELIDLGKIAKDSIRFNNTYYLIEKATEKSYFDNKLTIKINDKNYLNLIFLLPSVIYNTKLKFIKLSKHILVFYKYKFAHNLRPIIIPEYLKLDKIFLIGLGIYLAEGARNRRPKITNSDPIVINQGIKFFKLFNFYKSDFNAWIQLHERSNKSFKEVENFWIKNTNLDKQNIREIRIKKSMGNAEVEPYGALHLEINYLLFKLLINNLLKFTSEIIKRLSDEQLIWFLQGAYAGEGYVGLAKSGSVNTITYTSTRKGERSLIKEILIKFGIKVSENNKSGNLTVCGYENIKKLYEINLFEYHTFRKTRLENGLLKLEKSHIPFLNKRRILDLLNKEKNLTSFEIANTLNLSYLCTKKHLRELYYENKICKIGKPGPIPHKWFV